MATSDGLALRVQYLDDTDPFASTIFPEPTRPPSYDFNEFIPLVDQIGGIHRQLNAPHKLEDCTLQLSHNGLYLDLESSIDEQRDDFEGFQSSDGRKNSILLRTQLSVRVHACIEKLLNCTGRELRRALFSLKQIFQDDKDLVHEFVSADGLACLIKVGAEADQNYQNYILRALGQVMLYVDGMNGVIEHNETIQWLYSLIISKFRLVVKTSLKLLLVFIEYTETNVQLLVKAIKLVDKQQGQLAWCNLVTLIKDDSQDSEVLIYAVTLVNKALNGIPDQDTFYDITDALEEQKIEAVSQKFMNRRGADLDLLEQFRIYEMSLKHEDGDNNIPIEQHRNFRKNRRSADPQMNGTMPRKSKRSSLQPTQQYSLDTSQKKESTQPTLANESENDENGAKMTPYRRRRERRRRGSEEPPSVESTPTATPSTTAGEESLSERRQRVRQRAQQKQEELEARSSPTNKKSKSRLKLEKRRKARSGNEKKDDKNDSSGKITPAVSSPNSTDEKSSPELKVEIDLALGTNSDVSSINAGDSTSVKSSPTTTSSPEEISTKDEKFDPPSGQLVGTDSHVEKVVPSSLSLSLDSAARNSSPTQSDGKYGENTLSRGKISPAKASPTSSLDAFEFVSLGEMSPESKLKKPNWSQATALEKSSSVSPNSCTNTALHVPISKHVKSHLQDQLQQKHQIKNCDIVAEKQSPEIMVDRSLESKGSSLENDNNNINYIDIENDKDSYDEADDLIDDVRKSNHNDICDLNKRCQLESKTQKDMNKNTATLCSRLDAESKNITSEKEASISVHNFVENNEVGTSKYEKNSEERGLQAVVIDFEDDTTHRLADRIIGLDLTEAAKNKTVDPKPSLSAQFEADRAQLNSHKEHLHNSLKPYSNGLNDFNSNEIMDLDSGPRKHLTVNKDDTKTFVSVEDFEKVKFGIAINSDDDTITVGGSKLEEDMSNRDCLKNKEAEVKILLSEIEVGKENRNKVSQSSIKEKNQLRRLDVIDNVKLNNSEDDVDWIERNNARKSNRSSSDFSSEFFEDSFSDPAFSHDSIHGIESYDYSNTLVNYVEKCHSVGDTSDEYLSCEDEQNDIFGTGCVPESELQSDEDSDESEEDLSQILSCNLSFNHVKSLGNIKVENLENSHQEKSTENLNNVVNDKTVDVNEEVLIHEEIVEKDLMCTLTNGENVLETLCSDKINCSRVMNDVDSLSFGDSDSGVGDEDVSAPVHGIESENNQGLAVLNREHIPSGVGYDEVHSNNNNKDAVNIEETRKLEVCNVLGQKVKICNLSVEKKELAIETQPEIEKPKAKHEAVDSVNIDKKIDSDDIIGNITVDTGGVNPNISSSGQNEYMNSRDLHEPEASTTDILRTYVEKHETNTCESIDYCTVTETTVGETALVEPTTEGNGHQIQKENIGQLQVPCQELGGIYYVGLFQGKSPALSHLENANLIEESAPNNSLLDKSEKNLPQTNDTDTCKETADCNGLEHEMVCSPRELKHCDITEWDFSQINNVETSTDCNILGDKYGYTTDEEENVKGDVYFGNHQFESQCDEATDNFKDDVKLTANNVENESRQGEGLDAPMCIRGHRPENLGVIGSLNTDDRANDFEKQRQDEKELRVVEDYSVDPAPQQMDKRLDSIYDSAEENTDDCSSSTVLPSLNMEETNYVQNPHNVEHQSHMIGFYDDTNKVSKHTIISDSVNMKDVDVTTSTGGKADKEKQGIQCILGVENIKDAPLDDTRGEENYDTQDIKCNLGTVGDSNLINQEILTDRDTHTCPKVNIKNVENPTIRKDQSVCVELESFENQDRTDVSSGEADVTSDPVEEVDIMVLLSQGLEVKESASSKTTLGNLDEVEDDINDENIDDGQPFNQELNGSKTGGLSNCVIDQADNASLDPDFLTISSARIETKDIDPSDGTSIINSKESDLKNQAIGVESSKYECIHSTEADVVINEENVDILAALSRGIDKRVPECEDIFNQTDKVNVINTTSNVIYVTPEESDANIHAPSDIDTKEDIMESSELKDVEAKEVGDACASSVVESHVDDTCASQFVESLEDACASPVIESSEALCASLVVENTAAFCASPVVESPANVFMSRPVVENLENVNQNACTLNREVPSNDHILKVLSDGLDSLSCNNSFQDVSKDASTRQEDVQNIKLSLELPSEDVDKIDNNCWEKLNEECESVLSHSSESLTSSESNELLLSDASKCTEEELPNDSSKKSKDDSRFSHVNIHERQNHEDWHKKKSPELSLFQVAEKISHDKRNAILDDMQDILLLLNIGDSSFGSMKEKEEETYVGQSVGTLIQKSSGDDDAECTEKDVGDDQFDTDMEENEIEIDKIEEKRLETHTRKQMEKEVMNMVQPAKDGNIISLSDTACSHVDSSESTSFESTSTSSFQLGESNHTDVAPTFRSSKERKLRSYKTQLSEDDDDLLKLLSNGFNDIPPQNNNQCKQYMNMIEVNDNKSINSHVIHNYIKPNDDENLDVKCILSDPSGVNDLLKEHITIKPDCSAIEFGHAVYNCQQCNEDTLPITETVDCNLGILEDNVSVEAGANDDKSSTSQSVTDVADQGETRWKIENKSKFNFKARMEKLKSKKRDEGDEVLRLLTAGIPNPEAVPEEIPYVPTSRRLKWQKNGEVTATPASTDEKECGKYVDEKVINDLQTKPDEEEDKKKSDETKVLQNNLPKKKSWKEQLEEEVITVKTIQMKKAKEKLEKKESELLKMLKGGAITDQIRLAEKLSQKKKEQRLKKLKEEQDALTFLRGGLVDFVVEDENPSFTHTAECLEEQAFAHVDEANAEISDNEDLSDDEDITQAPSVKEKPKKEEELLLAMLSSGAITDQERLAEKLAKEKQIRKRRKTQEEQDLLLLLSQGKQDLTVDMDSQETPDHEDKDVGTDSEEPDSDEEDDIDQKDIEETVNQNDHVDTSLKIENVVNEVQVVAGGSKHIDESDKKQQIVDEIDIVALLISSVNLESESHLQKSSKIVDQNSNLKKFLTKEEPLQAMMKSNQKLNDLVNAPSERDQTSDSKEENILSLLKAGFPSRQLAEFESEGETINGTPRSFGRKMKTKDEVKEIETATIKSEQKVNDLTITPSTRAQTSDTEEDILTLLKAGLPNTPTDELQSESETMTIQPPFGFGRKQKFEEEVEKCEHPDVAHQISIVLASQMTVSDEDTEALFSLLKSGNEPNPTQASVKHDDKDLDIGINSSTEESSRMVCSESNLPGTGVVKHDVQCTPEETDDMLQDMHLVSQLTGKGIQDLCTSPQNTWWSETAESPQCSPYKTFSPSDKLYNNWWSMHHVRKSDTTIKEEAETVQSQDTKPKVKVLSPEPYRSKKPSCDTTVSEESKVEVPRYRSRQRNQDNADDIMKLLMHGDSTYDASTATRSKDKTSKLEVAKDDSNNNNSSSSSIKKSIPESQNLLKKSTVVESIVKEHKMGDVDSKKVVSSLSMTCVNTASSRPKKKSKSEDDEDDVLKLLTKGDLSPRTMISTHTEELVPYCSQRWRPRFPTHKVTSDTEAGKDEEPPKQEIESQVDEGYDTLPKQINGEPPKAEPDRQSAASSTTVTAITPRRSRGSEEIETPTTPVPNEVKSGRRRRRRHEGSDSTDNLSTTTPTNSQPDPVAQQTPVIQVQTVKAFEASSKLLAPETLPNGIASRRRRSKELEETSEKERRNEKDNEKEECSLSSCSSLSSLNKEAGDRSSCASSISIESAGSIEKVPLHSSQKLPSSPSEPAVHRQVQSLKTSHTQDTAPAQHQMVEPIQSEPLPDSEQATVNGPHTPQSAGLSDTKRYILDMTYKPEDAPTPSPTSHSRKISTCLHNSPSIMTRMESLKSPSTPLLPQQKEILNNTGKVQSVHDKLQLQSSLEESAGEESGRRGDVSGAISQAIQGLSRTNQPGSIPEEEAIPNLQEERKKEWEKILHMNKRELRIMNWDFTDLSTEDDDDILDLTPMYFINGIPPPPPPVSCAGTPPQAPRFMPPPPPVVNSHSGKLKRTAELTNKKKKTVRLHWKEANLEHPVFSSIKEGSQTGTIWETLSSVKLDCDKLEHLFENRTKDLPIKDQKSDSVKKNVLTVLDHKRSNGINIGLTVLPQPRTIKQAILNMDSVAINKEGVEKLLTLVPSDEEIKLIQDAKATHPDVPLGSAEQFLMTMSSVSGLKARLNLWLFKMDYETLEQEVAEPLADLKQGIEDLKSSKTLKYILATLLAIGNFLNGVQAKGFNLEYLARVPEVKDTVHKQSLLHHLCSMVIEKFPDSSDLYGELASISRCSKVDFEVLAGTLERMEIQCKQSWEHLRVISKHDSHSQLKNKLQEFLADSAQRIIVLKIVHRRVHNRFNKLLLYCGFTPNTASDIKVNEFCKVLSEFALEYRTARERVQEQEKKKENHRKRNKTRGKMIVEKFTGKDKEEDAKLQKLLKGSGTTPGDDARKARSKKVPGRHSMPGNGSGEPCEEQGDEMMDILVKSATAPSNRAPRERKRARHGNRKSLRRTLKGGLSEEEAKALGLAAKHETVKV